MKIGESQEVRQPYSPHKGHVVTLSDIDDAGDAVWSCSCGEEWRTAFDPAGTLGSDDYEEGPNL